MLSDNPQERVIWLRERTALGNLPEPALRAISAELTPKPLVENDPLLEMGELPTAIYLLESGYLNAMDGTGLHSYCFLPGSAIGLGEVLLNQGSALVVKASSSGQVWAVPASLIKTLAQSYPELSQTLVQQLAQSVSQLTSQLTIEQERQENLRPYLVPRAKRGIIGKSRYAVRLRQQIKDAAKTDGTIVIFGEPGLEKDNMAALIHFGSSRRRQPMIAIDCSKMQESGAELFGRQGGKPGLLEWVGQGTVLLNNAQDLPENLWPQVQTLVSEKTFLAVGVSEPNPPRKTCQARILITAEKVLPQLEGPLAMTIKVPPLRVRKTDLQSHGEYYISLICRARSCPRLTLTPEAVRRLQSYDFPGNLRELEALVERAIAQRGEATELTEEVFWAAETKKRRFRVNLLNMYPQFRYFLKSPWWPTRINYGLVLWLFAVVVAILFIGPQQRPDNVALNLFWCWWWPLILLGFPFVGRLWCAVCPFMIYGEVVQKLSLWLVPRSLKGWPRQQAETWGGWFLFGLFALIYLWEELWDLPNTAYLSSWLLLLITGGAVICSLIFERRFWCRYLCPIGGMNGLFAKLAMTELRAEQGTCSAECTTYQCYKGGPAKGEGLETNGCPLYSHPAQLADNRDCVLCMTCLKACPHRSVEINLRPPGIELWTTHIPRSYEVALLLLLLGGVFLHRLPELNARLDINLHLDAFWPHAGVSLAVLVIAGMIPLISGAIARELSPSLKSRSFLELMYGFLPLVWAGNLAHYIPMGLGEAGRLLPVTWATLGFHGEGLPILVAHPAVIAFLQGVTLILGLGLSMVLTHKIGRQSLLKLWPYHTGAIALMVGCWWLMLA
ncbi:sigma 54-interacting transcriptional regulator [Candidatus Synechococcus calcipolaris G9]|uniref:Sigma 54-interacting transcriptional regulator n=1 Tax=Candidatus Synechococcus calcipolaris G9 TaxID=1497997 RepID=A0ABT6EWR8_9SYNE|nr:sigma 54-interacting transcriptional regulator [Candidatus Synechococcus calcipolaris]MDG2990219.1 sigma 54-interacting transcriptional regulator [Candidatus Synechococcus calcipolaris G9]